MPKTCKSVKYEHTPAHQSSLYAPLPPLFPSSISRFTPAPDQQFMMEILLDTNLQLG